MKALKLFSYQKLSAKYVETTQFRAKQDRLMLASLLFSDSHVDLFLSDPFNIKYFAQLISRQNIFSSFFSSTDS